MIDELSGAKTPSSRLSLPLALLLSSLILAGAMLGSAWMLSHPDELTRCSESGGSWQVDAMACWYPNTSQPLLDPSGIKEDVEPSPLPVEEPVPADGPEATPDT